MKKLHLITLLSVIALIISFFFDKEINKFIFGLNPSFLKSFMLILDNWVTSVVLFLVIPSIILFRKRKKMVFLWITLVLGYLIATVLKVLIVRERPDLALIQEDSFSFPSRHAAVAFSVLPFMLEEKHYWIWILAILIGLSRLILGVHYLSDVIAGGLIGYYVGYSLLRLYKKEIPF
ncbi:MAG: phosphatase PAP2 family protein [Candidatus Woesearchaeota archaeon]|nr:MAG: phosphatase PAP2 family protein [Candidatus Woesearchaeota archaeon]